MGLWSFHFLSILEWSPSFYKSTTWKKLFKGEIPPWSMIWIIKATLYSSKIKHAHLFLALFKIPILYMDFILLCELGNPAIWILGGFRRTQISSLADLKPIFCPLSRPVPYKWTHPTEIEKMLKIMKQNIITWMWLNLYYFLCISKVYSEFEVCKRSWLD